MRINWFHVDLLLSMNNLNCELRETSLRMRAALEVVSKELEGRWQLFFADKDPRYLAIAFDAK